MFGEVTYRKEYSTEDRYSTKTEYLSGNIYKKLDAANAEIGKGNNEYKRNVSELQKILPQTATLDNAALSVKGKWLDPEVVENFLDEYLGIKASVIYDNILGSFKVSFNSLSGANDLYYSLDIEGKRLVSWFEDYMNGKSLNVYKKGKKDMVASNIATKKDGQNRRNVFKLFKS